VAEQIMAALPVVPEWEPVHGPSVIGEAPAEPDRDCVTARALELGLLPLRWPRVWPPDTEFAALTAVYAKRAGRAVAFSLAAFRQAFAGGRELGDRDTVLLAAAASEMHPTAVLKGVTLRSVTSALATANARAIDAGVDELPAIEIAGTLYVGESGLGEAVADLARHL
jgi:2-hydroxychromene-2-carboxylate isomerase